MSEEEGSHSHLPNSKFRQYNEWAADTASRWNVNTDKYQNELRKVGKELEDPITLVHEADNFFFNANGRRRVHPLNDTATFVAHLIEQGIYRNYLNHRGICTIPTLEFIDEVSKLIISGGFITPMEVGASDGGLSVYLRFHSGIGNLISIDDGNYGGKRNSHEQKIYKTSLPDWIANLFSNSEEKKRAREGKFWQDSVNRGVFHTSGRPISHQVEKIDLDSALNKYSPDFVFAAYLVNPQVGGEDDVKILDYPSVKQFLWIGEQSIRITSSSSLWKKEGWGKTDQPSLEKMIFTQEDMYVKRGSDGYLYQEPIAFPKDASPADIRNIMESKNIQRGKVVLFTRQDSIPK